jgi:ribosomal protein S16
MKNATITIVEFGTARKVFYQASVKASYTAESGRVISAIGWTVDTALRNLSRKTGVTHVATIK